ncbi:MAG: NusG domain II-containing protein [Candidatus Cloacimonetes bacterium]|nr:NusG domain II-containing protein [Candidatus Cloacimonadota bacterium]MBS3767874.1 NusG domain II-containing protein [Candidatus Cloacimonadota bacterium]
MENTFIRKLFLDILSTADKILIIIIAVLIILLSLHIIFPESNDSLHAICEIDGKIEKRIHLQKNKKIDLKNGIILETQNNQIRVFKSDCPHKICVKHGWIKHANDMIICVPNKTVIYLDKDSEIDYISH